MILQALKMNSSGVKLTLLNDDGATVTFACEDKPRPEMGGALQKLKPFLVEQIGLDGCEAADELEVTGFASNGKTVVVKANWPVPGASGRQNLSSIALPVDCAEDAESVGAYWGQDFADALKRCQDEGKAYYNGDRAQGQLNLEESE